MTPPPHDVQLAKALQSIAAGEFTRAAQLLSDLTIVQPSSAAAWKALGVAENKLGHQDAAERALKESVGLDPFDADAWSSLGGVYVAGGRHGEALRAFERGLRTGAVDSYSLLNYLTMAAVVGEFASALGQYGLALDAARRNCDAQIAAGENVPWCYYDLAQILFFQRRDDLRRPLQEALRRSSGWQVASARRTYELLAGGSEFRAEAERVLDEFAAAMSASGIGTDSPQR